MADYDLPAVYDDYADVPTDCGCALKGLIAQKDCDGNITGYLTPNDSEKYKLDTLEVPIGYVKVFNPDTDAFIGILTIADAMEYLTYLASL